MDDEYFTYLVASLIDNFHLTPNEIGKLTRIQIQTLYFFTRNDTGGLVAPVKKVQPVAPQNIPSKLEFLKMLKANLRVKGIDEEIRKLDPNNHT